MPGKLEIWKIGSVWIYPDLAWKKTLTNEELRKTAFLVQSKLTDMNITVWDESTYSAEVNGPWNVTLSIKMPNSNKSLIYMIRRDKQFNKTFGCPMSNNEYYKTDLPLSDRYNKDIFDRFRQTLIEILGEPEYIDYFETSK